MLYLGCNSRQLFSFSCHLFFLLLHQADTTSATSAVLVVAAGDCC